MTSRAEMPRPAAEQDHGATASSASAPLASLDLVTEPVDAGADAADATAERAAPKKTPDVVYVPTPQPIVDKMLALAKVKQRDIVYDLGCGDGRIVVTAAKRYGAKAFGFDVDPDRVAEARRNVRNAQVEHLVTIEEKDIFTLDLSPANVVTLYLLPELNVRLIPQLEKLKPGSRIVSHDFDMEGVRPLEHLVMKPPGEERNHEVYLWIAPLKRDDSTARAK